MRIRNPNALAPLHVVLLCVLAVTLLGGFLFLSAAESKILVDGAREWHEESPLRAVVQTLCLNYRFPTIYGGAVKAFLLGLGAGLALIALSVGFGVRSIDDAEFGDSADSAASYNGESTASRGAVITPRFGGAGNATAVPLTSAQIFALLYLLWSFASSRWSSAPHLAVGGSVLLTISFLWSYALGRGLSPRAARVGSVFMVAVTCATAAIAVWYYYGRNPTLRAKFPFGNPNFLAACLIPGILLSISFLGETASRAIGRDPKRNYGIAVLSAITLAIALWAFALTKSRGPMVGLLLGGATFLTLSLPRRWKLIPLGAAAMMTVAGTLYFVSLRDRPEEEARGSTIRFRLYAWRYAWDMFKQKPLHGHGQGGFTLAGDAHAVDDVLDDPETLGSRIAHAHSEWLEILADLGLLGLMLIAAALIATFRDGMLILRRGPPIWPLIGLLSALVALCVEESVSVGLRVSGVPIAFFTVLGLIWALSRSPDQHPHMFSRTKRRRHIASVTGCLAGVAIILTMQQEFLGAHDAYEADLAIQEGRVDEAVALADMAPSRLNPQRALTDQLRLVEAHMLSARKLQQRAAEREARAHQGDLVDRTVLDLADQDRRRSDNDCIIGSGHLRELVQWSPSFLNHGRMEYWLNVTMARNAAARQDANAEKLALQNAAVAIKREMRRQPFQPILAVEYLDIASEDLPLEEKILILARPLRHNDLTTLYVQALAQVTSNPSFETEFDRILRRAFETTRAIAARGPPPAVDDEWGPETLRIAAVIHFRRGDYDAATDALVVAASAYDRLASRAAIGAASCYKELADSRFFGHPNEPQLAIACADRALDLTPDSLPGRRLRQSIRSRLVDYHLASGQEDAARSILREDTSRDDVLKTEVGLRYRNLCDVLLRRRLAQILRKAPNEIVPKLQGWLNRSLELVPNDPVTHFLAADLAFHTGDYAATAAQLRQALDLGIAPETAYQFLLVAREKKPDQPDLEGVWQELTGGQEMQPDQPPGDARAGEPNGETRKQQIEE